MHDLLYVALSCRANIVFNTFRFIPYRQILHQIQNLEPPGRFLQKNYSTYEWQEVSHAVAREKVCQVSVIKILEVIPLLDLTRPELQNHSLIALKSRLTTKALRDSVAIEKDKVRHNERDCRNSRYMFIVCSTIALYFLPLKAK